MTGLDEAQTSASADEGAGATLTDEEIETRPAGALETAPDEDETSDPGDDSADVGDDSDDSGDSGDDSGDDSADDAPAAA